MMWIKRHDDVNKTMQDFLKVNEMLNIRFYELILWVGQPLSHDVIHFWGHVLLVNLNQTKLLILMYKSRLNFCEKLFQNSIYWQIYMLFNYSLNFLCFFPSFWQIIQLIIIALCHNN